MRVKNPILRVPSQTYDIKIDRVEFGYDFSHPPKEYILTTLRALSEIFSYYYYYYYFALCDTPHTNATHSFTWVLWVLCHQCRSQKLVPTCFCLKIGVLPPGYMSIGLLQGV